MIGNLATRNSRSGRQFKPLIYQGRRRENRGSYDRCSYDQQCYQNRYRSDNGDSIDKIEVHLDMNKIIKEESLEVI